MRRWIVALLLVTGCGDECIDAICPDADEQRSFPGPCRAAGSGLESRASCSFTYDPDRRIATAECIYDTTHDLERSAADWNYDAAGELVSVGAWTFEAEQVIVNKSSPIPKARFDRAQFAWLPLVGSDLARPDAELGLIETTYVYPSPTVTYQWTRDGSHLTRTGSNGSVVTYELDDRGRIVSSEGQRRELATVASLFSSSYSFSGDLLMSKRVSRRDVVTGDVDTSEVTYRYDRGGNVIEHVRESNWPYREVYDYSCWF